MSVHTEKEKDLSLLLAEACENNRIDEVRRLLDAGAPVDVRDGRGATLLLHASWSGHVGIVSLLLSSGSSVAAVDNDGWTPLMHASRHGHVDVVSLLLSSRASVTSDTVHIAVQRGYQEVVALLLKTSDVEAAAGWLDGCGAAWLKMLRNSSPAERQELLYLAYRRPFLRFLCGYDFLAVGFDGYDVRVDTSDVVVAPPSSSSDAVEGDMSGAATSPPPPPLSEEELSMTELVFSMEMMSYHILPYVEDDP